MTLLNGRLELHGVDVERLAAKAVDAWLRNHRSHLQPCDRDDLLAFVTAEIWRASVKYDPNKGPAFSTYAYRLAGARCVDWMRARLGRTRWSFGDGSSYTRERQQPLSLDARTPEGDSLGATLEGRTGDLAGDCDPELARLLACGDRTRAEDEALVRSLAA